MISSKEDAAISEVGIPFLTPNLYSCNIMHDGTNTAGLTAARMKPRAKQRAQGRPKTSLEIIDTMKASLI